MAVFKEWQGIRYIMQLMIINLVSCLVCLSAIAIAQLEFSEAVTGSVSFPDGAIACIGNLAVFFTSLLRGRLDLENGARDVLATNRGPKLKKIKGSGVTTCDVDVETEDGRKYKDAKVVMLARDKSNLNSIKQFMKYIQHSHGVDSILLECLDLQCAVESKVVITVEPCGSCHYHLCKCIVLRTEEEKIALMIARRMPGTLKRLPDSFFLLPCWDCLTNGCHGCNQGLLHVRQKKGAEVESPQTHAEQSKCIPLQSAVITAERCCDQFHECKCNVLWTEEEEMRMMFGRWMPGTLKRLSNSLCLQPSWDCLRRGCHGLLRTEKDSKGAESSEIHPECTLEEEEPKAEYPAAVCQMLDDYDDGEKPDCICIPLREASHDEWTKLMIRFMRSRDKVAREVRVRAADAMEKYINRSGEFWQARALIEENYRGWPLIVQRFIEVSVNIVLTVWLRVDGLSSSLIARRLVRHYIVDTKGTGFNADVFLTSVQVVCNESSVCQMLWFRGNVLRVRTVSYIVGSVNLICAISWGVLMACEGRYGMHSMQPSKPRVIVMLAFIAVALLMDFVDLVVKKFEDLILRSLVIAMEIAYIVSGSVIVAKGLGTGKWMYSALQALIWVKWAIGSYLLGDRDDSGGPVLDPHRRGSHRLSFRCWSSMFGRIFSHKIVVYSGAFMLNAILAGVRGKWEY